MKEIKNKLQQMIKNIKTFFINKLCVSLKKKTNIVNEEKFCKFEETNFNKKHMAHFEVTEEIIEKVNENFIKNKGKNSLKDSERIIKIKDLSESEINNIWGKVYKKHYGKK